MLKPRAVLFTLIGLILLIAGAAAARMITAANYMTAAADHAMDHLDELPIPQPLPASTPLAVTPDVIAVARYGEAVEVQITRHYRTARRPEAAFAVTYFYQPTTAGWQLIPAPDTFWGEMQTTAGKHVSVIHPQRDQKLVDNLIKAVDPVIESACTRWECQIKSMPVTFRFVTESTGAESHTYVVPRLTGVPMSREANDDYLAYLAAEAIRLLAGQLGKSADAARAEIQRQALYLP